MVQKIDWEKRFSAPRLCRARTAPRLSAVIKQVEHEVAIERVHDIANIVRATLGL